MNIQELLKGVDCDCGKKHTCDIEHCYIEEDACNRLTNLCKEYNKILIVADENTFNASGEKVVSAIDKPYEKVIFSGKTILVPNEDAIRKVEDNLNDCDLIIGIGSGVIQDLCKYVSFFKKVDYFIVATAPSMDGYASTGAAMILGGMKVTVSVGAPKAIIADVDVLANAPHDMIKAGYGDIVGKFSSLNDWKLSKIVNDEYFCQYIYDLVKETLENTLKLSSGLLKEDKESVKALMEALVIVGVALSFVGNSRPASGSEHHLSHFFEITGLVFNEEYFCHGLDVAYSTVITAKIREEILSKPFNKTQFFENKTDLMANLQKVYGKVAKGCFDLQEKLGTYTADRVSVYLEKEEEIREVLKEMPSAKEIEKLLSAVEIDMKDFYALYGEQKINDAIRYAKDLKDRYTVLWLNYDLNGGDSYGFKQDKSHRV